MWKFRATISLVSILLATVQAEQSNFLMEYSIASSNPVRSYHYPAPPKSQQLYDPVSSQPIQAYQNQYQAIYRSPYTLKQSSVINKQFVSPSLDNAAFNLALTEQGYKYGKTRAFNAALTASPRSSKTNSHTSVSSSSPVLGSLNVRLPLPLGISPLNIAPLPLQAGTPYSSITNSVTSYGTVYPQRK